MTLFLKTKIYYYINYCLSLLFQIKTRLDGKFNYLITLLMVNLATLKIRKFENVRLRSQFSSLPNSKLASEFNGLSLLLSFNRMFYFGFFV